MFPDSRTRVTLKNLGVCCILWNEFCSSGHTTFCLFLSLSLSVNFDLLCPVPPVLFLSFSPSCFLSRFGFYTWHVLLMLLVHVSLLTNPCLSLPSFSRHQVFCPSLIFFIEGLELASAGFVWQFPIIHILGVSRWAVRALVRARGPLLSFVMPGEFQVECLVYCSPLENCVQKYLNYLNIQ